MVLATATVDGRPSARVVLLKTLVVDPGYVVFYTNYDSRKGRELDANPRAAAVVHWDTLGRQVRLEGAVSVSPREESDAYFASRPLDSRIGAWASLQSQPLDTRATLLARVAAESARLGADVPRPPRWGGYRLWPEAVELWTRRRIPDPRPRALDAQRRTRIAGRVSRRALAGDTVVPLERRPGGDGAAFSATCDSRCSWGCCCSSRSVRGSTAAAAATGMRRCASPFTC